MAAAQQGNGGAYRRLLMELKQWLTSFFARRLPDRAIDDAIQDTLISIHEKRHTYDPRRPFKPWAAAIARYKWIDRLRSMRHQSTFAVGEERDQAMNSIAPVWDGNETWLVLGGGGLMAAFPLAFSIILPATYPLMIAMLLGLVCRGVAFEFRWRDENHRRY
jgi:hypothetical protein